MLKYYFSADSKMKESTILGFIHSFFHRFENRSFKKSSILETKLIHKTLTPKCISKRFKYHITYHVKAWIFELNLQIVFKQTCTQTKTIKSANLPNQRKLFLNRQKNKEIMATLKGWFSLATELEPES